MKLETERLELLPLTPPQLRMWLEDLPALERMLCCTYRAEPIDGIFRNIISEQAAIAEQEPEQYLWHSFWFLIRKSDRVVVGSADFKAPPDKHGEVEIGYGLGSAYEHFGYMTEAVSAMRDWALRIPGVTAVIAETERDSHASQRILRRCGFTLVKSGDTLWWRT